MSAAGSQLKKILQVFLRIFELNFGNTIVNCSYVHVSDDPGEGTKAHRGWAQYAQCEQKWIRDQASNLSPLLAHCTSTHCITAPSWSEEGDLPMYFVKCSPLPILN